MALKLVPEQSKPKAEAPKTEEFDANRIDSVILRPLIAARMVELKLSHSALAKQTGVLKSTLTRWLADAYRGNNDKVAEKMAAWLAAHGRSRSYVATRTSLQIMSGLKYIHDRGIIGCIYGAPGVGKTTTMLRYAAEYAKTTRSCTMTPARKNVVPCLETINEHALGKNHCNGANRNEESILSTMRQRENGDVAPRLLIIDEAQHLTTESLDQIRSLHDRVRPTEDGEPGVGIAFVGNYVAFERLKGTLDKRRQWAQINSRIGLTLCLGGPSEDDVRVIAASWGVTDPEVIKLLVRASGSMGALRSVQLLLAGARDTEHGITPDGIYTVCELLGAEL